MLAFNKPIIQWELCEPFRLSGRVPSGVWVPPHWPHLEYRSCYQGRGRVPLRALRSTVKHLIRPLIRRTAQSLCCRRGRQCHRPRGSNHAINAGLEVVGINQNGRKMESNSARDIPWTWPPRSYVVNLTLPIASSSEASGWNEIEIEKHSNNNLRD